MKSKTKLDFKSVGENHQALFNLTIHRGEGMALIAMDWKNGQPPNDFVGFAIEYKEPEGVKFFPLKNRIAFTDKDDNTNKERLSTRFSPIQMFRWVHFPRNANQKGLFVYRITPVFMNEKDELSYGDFQEASIELHSETYPDMLNVTFTRGFVTSQAFVDRYVTDTDGMDTLIPSSSKDGPDFIPTHPKATEALNWMGFEATSEIFKLLDEAIEDTTANVLIIAYDLSERNIVEKLELLGNRLQIIIDDSTEHKKQGSAENQVEERLVLSAGRENVKRQHMGNLQHNKTIVVDGDNIKAVVCGSTNYTWRGFYVQSNNAVIIKSQHAVEIFSKAFKNYWENETIKTFGKTASTKWHDIKLDGIDASVSFSPHSTNPLLDSIGEDVSDNVISNVLYSLAFLAQTKKGAIRPAIEKVTMDSSIFVYGITDRKLGGLDLQVPNGNTYPVYPAELSKNLPEPFKSEPTGLSGGIGTRMHHKFIVIDFNLPTARVYLGSYNFSVPADNENGENLLLIKDQKIATSYMIEALRLFDHYHFRVVMKEAKKSHKRLVLAKPPRNAGEKPWWKDDYTNPRKIKDRVLFSS